MGWAGNTWTGSREWLDVELLWDRAKSRIAPDQQLELRFEDLARQPVETLTRICAGDGQEGDIERLEELALTIKSASLCGLGQTAANPAARES
jgi:hypothetical protein